MSFKLRVASIWTPKYFLIPELDRVAEVTVDCLDQLIEKYSLEKLNVNGREKPLMKGNIEERREIMATAHNIRVNALIDALGYDKAIEVGRKALFKAGMQLGQDAREQLSVGDSIQDLIRAARVLYRVLGIEFQIRQEGEEIIIIVDKCSLSTYYSPETCRILSAADEGVVQGLNPNIHMVFKERMTEGSAKCMAFITIVINRLDKN